MDDYQPISPKEIDRAYFFLTHKKLFIKIAFGFAILVLAIIYVVLIINIITLVRTPSFSNMAAQLSGTINWASYHASRAPQPILTTTTKFVPLGDGRYNLVAFVENPNDDWSAKSFQYKFVVNGQELQIEESFLNPAEKRMILEMGYNSPVSIQELQFNVGNVSWRRFENDIPEINWDISNVSYKPARTVTIENEAVDVPASVNWTATNLSLYDFWEVGWQIALFDGDRLIGVNQVNSVDFMSLESREMSPAWLKELPRVNKVEIFPVVDWLDKDNFKSYYQEEREIDRVNR